MLRVVRSLDVAAISGHFRGVKTLVFLLILTLNACCDETDVRLSSVPPRNIVPMEVKERAQSAVQKIVDETVRGNFKAALDSMNPGFVKVISRPYGGPAKYKAALMRQMNELGQNGITFQAAITRKADIAFEVDYGFENHVMNGKVVLGKDGKPQQVARYRSWMVFVPTVKDFQVLDKSTNPAKLRKFRKWDFEVAISPKKNENWTLVNGSSVNALQLRKLFKFLPKDDKKFQFPEVKSQELK